MRAIKYHAPNDPTISFTDAFFINKSQRDDNALRTRIHRECEHGRSRISESRIRIIKGDANDELRGVMEQIPRKDYIFAFVDITGIAHWPFKSMQLFKSLGHLSVDLYLLFPLEMTLIRKLSFQEEMTERYADDLTAFFGGEEWRALHRQRRTPAETDQLKRDITELYLGKIKPSLWTSADVHGTISMADNRPLYRMIFASNEPIATTLSKWQKTHNQGELFEL